MRIFFKKNFQDSLPLKIEPIGCPDTAVRNYQYTLHVIPEVRKSHEFVCCPKLNIIF